MIKPQELQQVILCDVGTLQIDKKAEKVALSDCVGRIVATDITSPLDIPPAAVSAMDGYAVSLADADPSKPAVFECIGESVAGKPFVGSIENRQCIRIMTGARVPDGVDTVIMQENVTRTDNTINLTRSATPGDNIRQRGEEVTRGEMVLQQGHLIADSDIPLLAAMGMADVPVYPRLRVGLFSTGGELCELGKPLTGAQIYDSNRPTIKAFLRPHPVAINDYGIIEDDLAVITETLKKAADENDIVVTSGGVSVGDYDFLKDAVSSVGNVIQYKVALKPGKPFVYGKIGKARYFGLPGNPLSTALSARLFLLPAIYRYFDAHPLGLQFRGELSNAIKRKAGRAELQRGVAEYGNDGKWRVSTAGYQDSHRVYQLSRANVLVFLSAEQTELSVGDTVELLPLYGRFL